MTNARWRAAAGHLNVPPRYHARMRCLYPLARALVLLSWICLTGASACTGKSAATSVQPPAPPAPAAEPADPLLAALLGARAARPGDGAIRYALATAYAGRGNRDAALAELQALVHLGWSFAPAASDFGALANDPAIGEALARLARSEPQVRRSVQVLSLADCELIPEGIAHDPVTDTFYVGSIYKRSILAIDKDRTVSTFLPKGTPKGSKATDSREDNQAELLSVLGLKVDAERRHLWAATFASTSMRGYEPADKDRDTAALIQVDLTSGAVLRTVTLAEPGVRHLLNDLAIGPGGEVYVTDSEAGGVYVLRPDAGALEPLVPAGTLFYPNGIAISANGETLFVAHYPGIVRIDTRTGGRLPLAVPPRITTAGIDGLALHGTSLIAVQNGLGRARITRYHLTPGLDAVTAEEILESGNPLFAGIPTTGVVAGDAFYYIANSQIRSLGSGGIAPTATLVETEIHKVPL